MQYFCRDKFCDWETPLKVIRQKIEGASDFTSLLFIPFHAPYNYYSCDCEKGLQLYSSGGAVSVNMEKELGKNPGNESAHIKAESVLEINMNHPIYAKLKELFENDKDKLASCGKILYAQASLVSGLAIENPAEVSELDCNLIIQ